VLILLLLILLILLDLVSPYLFLFSVLAMAPSHSRLCILSDSLLSHARFGPQFLNPHKPTPPVSVNVSTPHLPLLQFSYSGLTAFSTRRNGQAHRATLFSQLAAAYPAAEHRPRHFFCVLGLNDLHALSPSHVRESPHVILEHFISFFAQLRDFSPGAQVHWLGFGTVWSSHPLITSFQLFSAYLRRSAGLLPSWLHYADLTSIITDRDIKDHVGHWSPAFLRCFFKIVLLYIAKVLLLAHASH
jgi:hypothetical protein